MKTLRKVLIYPPAAVGVLMAAVAVADRISQRRRYLRAAPAREAARLAGDGGVVRESEHDSDGRPVPVEAAAVAGREAVCESFQGLPITESVEAERMATRADCDGLWESLSAALTGVAPVRPAPRTSEVAELVSWMDRRPGSSRKP